MPSSYPERIDSFNKKTDNVDVIMAEDINQLQNSITSLENNLSLLIKDDESLLTLAHFENSTTGYRNFIASEEGAVRYVEGKFGKGLFIETGTSNYVKNPAIRETADLWTLTMNTGSASIARITTDCPPEINSPGCLEICVNSSGNADGMIKTEMTGLEEETNYAISFWVKNQVNGNSFSGDDIKIADSSGGGIAGQAFSIDENWSRIEAPYSTAAGQDSFVLEVHFSKVSASVNDKILIGGFQVEEGDLTTTYCDGSQGIGYSWTGSENASESIRQDTEIQYQINQNLKTILNSDSGTIGFWVKPSWGNGTSAQNYFLETLSSPLKKKISLYKDEDDKLNFKITEPDDSYVRLKTDSAINWEPAGGWLHIACTYSFDEASSTWTLNLYVDGEQLDCTSTGDADTSSSPGDYLYLGADENLSCFANAVFDDFFTRSNILTEEEIQKICDLPAQMTEGVINATMGSDTTDATAGTSKAITHGLGAIPAFIEITEKGPGLVYLSDSDSATDQYFFVKSTASSVNFNWRAWPR